MDSLNQKRVIIPMNKKELQTFFDSSSLKAINYFLSKSILSQPEKCLNQDDIPVQIPKEHIEQWVCQSIGAIPKGAGSYAIDVISKDHSWGADIKSLGCSINEDGSLQNADSGETSLAQKFDDSNFGENITLDDLFANKEYQIIWDSWKNIIKSKYEKVEQDLGITKIYFFFILRAGMDFHLCGMKIKLENLNHTKINYDRSTNKSMWIKNYIDDDFGHVKVYKSKKRFELRLRPKFWVDNNMVISFNTNFKQFEADIRKLIENNKINLHIKNNLIPILINSQK